MTPRTTMRSAISPTPIPHPEAARTSSSLLQRPGSVVMPTPPPPPPDHRRLRCRRPPAPTIRTVPMSSRSSQHGCRAQQSRDPAIAPRPIWPPLEALGIRRYSAAAVSATANPSPGGRPNLRPRDPGRPHVAKPLLDGVGQPLPLRKVHGRTGLSVDQAGRRLRTVPDARPRYVASRWAWSAPPTTL